MEFYANVMEFYKKKYMYAVFVIQIIVVWVFAVAVENLWLIKII